MKIIDEELLNKVSLQARNSERLRMNFNFHDTLESPVQKLLNAIEPGTVVPVHRHLYTSEAYILLRGRLQVRFYDDSRNLTDEAILDAAEGKFGIDIPAGQWHTLEVLESGTVIYEVKQGPYSPLAAEDILQAE